jgi:hypothetical protein
MRLKKEILICLLFVISIIGRTFAQGSPEKFSKEFLNGFINYNEEKLKLLLPSDPTVQADMLVKLKELYTKQVKPIKTAAMTTTVRAVLKDGTKEYKQISDIIITISPDQKTKYDLTLFGCYVKDGKWLLGEKIDFTKIVQM